MTKQEIMDAITGCAQKLGRTPSILEVMKMGQVSRRQMRAEFGSFTQALRECNLEREISSGQKVPLEQLFVDWAGVVRKVGKAPSMSEYEAMSKFSCKPLVRCFGSWRQVAYGLTQFAEGRGLAEQWKAELELAAVKGGDQDAQWMLSREAPTARAKMLAAFEGAGADGRANRGGNLWASDVAGAAGVCAGERAGRGVLIWMDGAAAGICSPQDTARVS
jgi:hypothetical protein